MPACPFVLSHSGTVPLLFTAEEDLLTVHGEGFSQRFADPLLETGRALSACRDDTFSCLTSCGD